MGRREAEKLSAMAVKKQSTPGYHLDGGGLYLQVSQTGSKSWIFKYTLNKRTKEMGLGSYPDVSLAQARLDATAQRLLLKDKIDPLEARRTRQRSHQRQRTFIECAGEYYDTHKGSWKSGKHSSQWTNTLATYAYPIFGTKNVSEVNKADILAALTPIWTTKQVTATRVKQRIQAVLDWAAAKDYRHSHDSGIWAQITRALPKVKSTRTNFKSCPYRDVHSTIQTLQRSGCEDTVKLALEFIILTAARTKEVRFARWSEIDLKEESRTIPAEEMKSGKEHRVPLSPRVMEILLSQKGNGSDLIFANKKGKPYSDMTFTAALRRLGMDFKVHGFRSTFRDWAAEQTSYPHAVCEAALAHTRRDKTEAAYLRTDLFERRRELMNDWAKFCLTPVTESLPQTMQRIENDHLA